MLTLLPLGVAATPASLLARTIYFGDLHTHSEASFDGTGSVEGLFTLGRDVIGLDFMALTDHDFSLTPEEWALAQTVAASFDQPGRFVALAGIEWTRRWHMSAYFAGDDEEYCPTCEVADFYALYGPRVLAGEAAAHVNHPSHRAPFFGGVDWTRIDDRVTTNVEVWNSMVAGDNEAGFGNALWALQMGFRLGLVGVSDDHRIDGDILLGTGLTGCHADALTRADILAALRARRCYATNGERILLDIRVDDTAMGGEVTAPLGSIVNASVAVFATEVPKAIEILRNGTVVARKIDCGRLGCGFSAPVRIDDLHTFIHARVHQPGGKKAWSSPVWVTGVCDGGERCPLWELLPGGGDPARSCLTEWRVPVRGVRGSPVRGSRVTCTDGSAYDAGTEPGECTFRVGLCFGVRDPGLPACTPAPVEGLVLAHDGRLPLTALDFQNRLAILSAVRALGPVVAPGSCTPLLDLRVPTSRAGGRPERGDRTLITTALSPAGDDHDRLTLRCRPR